MFRDSSTVAIHFRHDLRLQLVQARSLRCGAINENILYACMMIVLAASSAVAYNTILHNFHGQQQQ
jgi:hypothetical protein